MSKAATYAKSGVHLDRYNEAIARLLRRIRSTHDSCVIDLPMGFAGLYSLARKGRYRDPVLVSCSDSVGTKLRVAIMARRHDTVGIDLVAMSVNDLIVTGATPLFFLDCISTGHLKGDVLLQAIGGIVEGCRQADCALLGGETAELPGMFARGDYDMTGFAVGVAERRHVIDGSKVRPGDVILGLPSSGLHSNGYSLVRKILFEDRGYGVRRHVKELGGTLADTLLAPTRIYVRPIRKLLRQERLRSAVHAMAHITGGGLVENIPRILPKGCAAEIHEGTWDIPPIFPYLQRTGPVALREMYRVFNMGVGMAVLVAARRSEEVRRALRRAGEKPRVIGRIVRGPQEVRIIPASRRS